MSDTTSGLTEAELADLCALADGTLPDERRARVEAWVAVSAERRELLDRQRRAVLALRTLGEEEAPASLRAGVEALRRPPSARARRLPRLAAAGAAVAAAAVVAAVVLSGGPGAPTVADAARLALESPAAPAPRPVAGSATRLAARVDGVVFPYLAPLYGWKAEGIRRGRVDGRDATVVYYAKGGRRLGYAIVSGPGLDRPAGARATVRRGVLYQILRLDGKLSVTWRRGGHTCVLIGDAPGAELVQLASWPLRTPR